jgi:hypothetical protein
LHQDDFELEEYYLDWFFLSKFGKSKGYWKDLTDDDIMTTITLQTEHEHKKEKNYWDNWQKLSKGGMR